MFKDFIDNTSLHGMRYINEKNVFRKLFWISCVVAAFAFCVNQTVDSIRYYKSNPYSTTIETKQEEHQKFPRVSFCNMNLLHTGKYRDYVKTKFPGTSDSEIEADIRYMARNLRRVSEKAIGVNYTRYLPLNKTLVNLTRMQTFYTTNTTIRSHLIHEMLLPKELFSCVYQSSPCNIDDFQPFNVTPYGLCYTFQPRNKEVKLTGQAAGLRLLMNVGSHFYISSGYNINIGFIVSVHPNDAFPNIGEGILIQPGVYTSCEARRKQFLSLEYPYATNCGVDKKWKFGERKYRQKFCQMECYLREVRSTCKCTTDTGSDEYPYCLTDSQVNCNSAVLESLKESKSYLDCRDSCPESCSYTEYETRTSTSSFNVKNLVWDANDLCGSELKQNENICQEIREKSEGEKYQYFRENIVIFEVYLKDSLYEKVEQVPTYEEFALISNIGGNLGLFLGMSVLTLTEFVEFAVIALWKKLRQLTRPNKADVMK